mmetsp:Transcript_4329/g.12479  ORF Transcript_4329/g.12479 Transcript_4329/m.12479 type:complete len:210 (-) Transcript_4329:1616-2245(-)
MAATALVFRCDGGSGGETRSEWVGDDSLSEARLCRGGGGGASGGLTAAVRAFCSVTQAMATNLATSARRRAFSIWSDDAKSSSSWPSATAAAAAAAATAAASLAGRDADPPRGDAPAERGVSPPKACVIFTSLSKAGTSSKSVGWMSASPASGDGTLMSQCGGRAVSPSALMTALGTKRSTAARKSSRAATSSARTFAICSASLPAVRA